MRSKCRSSSILLKNGKAAEKTKTRIAAATQMSRIRRLSLLFADVFDSIGMLIDA
jgi:hypothetical protein